MNKKVLAREAAEGALMDAAWRLLRRDGVLAGLNMNEVAEEARVNRGLIHRWFGSRRELLRAAIRRKQEGLAGAVGASFDRSVNRRTSWAIRQYVADPSYAEMVMLLSLDGDEQFDPIPYLDTRLERFRAEKTAGVWTDDADPVALSVLWDVLLNGYFTMRRPVARQTGLSVEALDRRVFTAVGRFYSAYRAPQHASASGSGAARGQR